MGLRMTFDGKMRRVTQLGVQRWQRGFGWQYLANRGGRTSARFSL